MQKLRFIIAGDNLYAANTGTPFTRQGVVSICNQNLSAKGQRAADIDTYEDVREGLLDHIRAIRIKSYRDDSNLLVEHRNAEDETTSDYAGRCLFELLQNADDAMAPPGADRAELIGAKGLGFKSVLEITERPEIHSAGFHFGFDAGKSRALLDDVRHAELVGIFRVPHEAAPDAQVTRLLRDGFTTIVRLPFRDEQARHLAEEQLAALSPHFLLLAQHLDMVEIRSPALPRTISRSGPRGSPEGGIAELRVKDRGEPAVPSAWRVWRETWPPADDHAKRLSAAIAIPLERGVTAPTTEALPLHVFYPTDDELELPFLVHASLELQHNRKHVRAGANDTDILDRLAGLAGRIAVDIPPEAALAIFRDLVINLRRAKPGNLRGMIRQRLAQAVLKAEFVPVVGPGTRRVAPPAARTSLPGLARLLRRNRPDVAQMAICAPSMDDVLKELQQFNAKPLEPADYAELLRHVRCRTVEDCRAAAEIVARGCLAGWIAPGMLRTLRHAPIWFTEAGEVRSLSGTTPLLLTRPADWPDWCEADVLDPRLAESLFPGGTIARPWIPLVEGKLHHRREDYLRQCISPLLARWPGPEWARHGWAALRLIENWVAIDAWDKVRPFVPGTAEDLRSVLVEVVRVPSGKAWVSARACYATREIGAAPGLARAFTGIEGRYRCGRPAESKQHFAAERWRALLRYLGVSWEPKIQQFDKASGTDLAEPSSPEFWSAIYSYGLRYRDADWYLEHFPAGLLEAGVPPAAMMAMVASIAGAMEGRRGQYSKIAGPHPPHDLKPWNSFVHHQLQTAKFLPVRPGIDGLRMPRDGGSLYWPRTGLKGFTPELELAGLNDAQRARLKPVLTKALNLNDALPDHWAPWRIWCGQLADAVAAGREIKEKVVRDFYEAVLSRKFQLPAVPAPDRLVCIVADAPFGLRAVPSVDAAWIDKPMLANADVLNALVGAGLAYIPPLLDRGVNAPIRLGLHRASDVVEIAAEFAQESEAETLKMGRLLSARWKAIAVQCEAKNVRPPPRPTIRAVRGLTLELSVDGVFASKVATAAYKDGEEWLVSLDGDRWEALATALADGLGHGTDLRYRFAAVLRARSGRDVRRTLQEDGIPAYRLDAAGLEDNDEPPAEPAAPEGVPEPGDEPEGWPGSFTPEPSPAPPSPPPAPAPSPPGPAEPVGTVYGTGRLKERPLYDQEPSGSGNGGGGWGGASQLGMEGEKWLEQRMRATMPPGADLVLHLRDEQRRESDLVLTMSGRSWHIEVKTLSSERFYWSGLEIEKAKLKPGAYWMCFLIREGWGFRAHWSWSPLDDLLACERRMQWQWAFEAQGPLLEKDSWMPADGVRSPERPPDRATAVIRIREDHLAGLVRDGPELTAFWQRIREL